MRMAVLRAYKTKWNPKAYLRKFRLSPDALWRAGERGFRGRIRTKSGFNLHIADASSAPELVRQVRAWIQQNESALKALRATGATAEIDFGFTVGTLEQFTARVTLPVKTLALLADIGLNLTFSAYPASDDNNGTDTKSVS